MRREKYVILTLILIDKSHYFYYPRINSGVIFSFAKLILSRFYLLIFHSFFEVKAVISNSRHKQKITLYFFKG